MLIQFGIINYKLILPFIYPFFFQLIKFIHKDDKRPFYLYFTSYLGYIFHGIIYLIIIKRMKKTRKTLYKMNGVELNETFNELIDLDKSTKSSEELKSNSNGVVDLEFKKINSRLKRKKYIYIILLVLLYLIPMLLDSYCFLSDNKITTDSAISLFFCIISYVILSRIILGNKIYRHQIFSSIIIIICNILIIIIISLGGEYI